MKQHYLLGICMLGAMLTACTDEDQSVSNLHEGGLKATVESNRISSRAGFTTGEENKGAFYWSKGDKIGVTTTKNKLEFSTLAMNESGIGQSSATFNGIINGTPEGYAVYPCDDGHSMNGTTLTYHFKPAYTYTKVDADFATAKQGEGNSFNPPMWGNITGGTVALKHLGAVCCIKIDKLPTGADLKLTLTSDKKINGTYTVDFSSDTPQIEATASTDDAEKTVTITFSNNNENASGVFYVPLPVGEHTLRLKVLDGTNEKINAALGTFNITRTLLKRLDLTNGSINAGGAKEVSSAGEVEKALGLSDIVAVTGAISSDTEVKIPATSTTGKAKSVTFESVGNAKLTVTDATTEDGTSVEKLTLAFAANETVQEDNAPTLVVNTPNSTTTLEATSGTLKLKEATASTADNTLVVGAGVTIKKLIVQKGNIRAKKGSVITEITRSVGNSSTYIIYKEDGATLPSTTPEGFTVVDAALADLQNVAREGGTYTLTKDLEGDFTISATNDVIINLNGHKITNKSGDTFTVNKGSKLTISGSGTVDNVTHAKACIYNNGTVALNGGTYTRSKEASSSTSSSGGNSYYNILNHGEMTIQPGVMISSSGAFSSLIDNGYYSYTDTNERVGYVEKIGQPNPSLTINGGTFSGGINTIKNDDGATLTIVNGTFTNMTQATVQNNNVAEIRGGEFNPTGSASHAVETKHNTADYNKGETKISGGTFNGLMYVSGDSPSLTVTGGTFSDPSALTYLGNNADVKVVMNKDYTMAKALNIAEDANVTVDLNSKILEITDATIESRIKGTAYFKNGTINTANTFYAQSNGNLTFDNVKVIETRHTAIQAQGPNVKLTVKNNSVITGRYFGISTNASNSGAGQSPTYGQNATIVLENSRFDSEETGFMNNVPAKVTITGCEFSGNHQGVLLRGGDYTIKNSTFTLNASLDETSYAEDSWTAQSGKWADGNRCAFAGITMGNKESNSYQYYTKVAMENVTVKVEGTYASQYPAVYVAANKATDLGVTWTFDTSCVFGIGQTSIEYGSSNNITVNGNAIQPSDK